MNRLYVYYNTLVLSAFKVSQYCKIKKKKKLWTIIWHVYNHVLVLIRIAKCVVWHHVFCVNEMKRIKRDAWKILLIILYFETHNSWLCVRFSCIIQLLTWPKIQIIKYKSRCPLFFRHIGDLYDTFVEFFNFQFFYSDS